MLSAYLCVNNGWNSFQSSSLVLSVPGDSVIAVPGQAGLDKGNRRNTSLHISSPYSHRTGGNLPVEARAVLVWPEAPSCSIIPGQWLLSQRGPAEDEAQKTPEDLILPKDDSSPSLIVPAGCYFYWERNLIYYYSLTYCWLESHTPTYCGCAAPFPVCSQHYQPFPALLFATLWKLQFWSALGAPSYGSHTGSICHLTFELERDNSAGGHRARVNLV